MRFGLVLAVVVAASFVSGCLISVPGLDDAEWPCVSDDDCAEELGYRCDESFRCSRKPLPPDAGDVVPGDRDAGMDDAGPLDAGEGGPIDSGSVDGGAIDGGLDAGPLDGGPPDGGLPDGGSPNDAGPPCPLGLDEDGDGYGEGCAWGDDCDETDPNRWLQVALYLDEDDDGVVSGAPSGLCIGATLPTRASLAPPDDGDCDDTDPTRWHLTEAWPDADEDGVALTMRTALCVGDALPTDFLSARPGRPDCDDTDPRRSPGGTEICDGLDNDCDGIADEGAVCPCAVLYRGDRLHPYLACTSSASWPAARDTCEANGYRLAIAEDEAEHDFLRFLLLATGSSAWIGLNDLEEERTFRWLDGSVPAFDGWNEGEPNHLDGEHCAELQATGWNDLGCDQGRPYLCEAAPPAPPDDRGTGDAGPADDGGDAGDEDAGVTNDAGPPGCADDDRDGWYTGPCGPAPDCDDGDSTRFAWRVGYADTDDDGYAEALPELLCTDGALPMGWHDAPPEAPDCDDDDASVLDTITAYPDLDLDGAPSASGVTVGCAEGRLPDSYTAEPPTTPDCDDDNPTRAPGLTEACDGRDEDCSGFADDGDVCPCPVAYPPDDPLRPYLFCTSPSTSWLAAREICFATGYDLVLVEDESENAFLQQEIDARGNGAWWAGGTDLLSEGTWSWLDGTVFWQAGTTVTYADWVSSPATNNNSDDCLVLRTSDWNDIPCDRSRKFICELPAAP